MTIKQVPSQPVSVRPCGKHLCHRQITTREQTAFLTLASAVDLLKHPTLDNFLEAQECLDSALELELSLPKVNQAIRSACGPLQDVQARATIRRLREALDLLEPYISDPEAE